MARRAPRRRVQGQTDLFASAPVSGCASFGTADGAAFSRMLRAHLAGAHIATPTDDAPPPRASKTRGTQTEAAA